MENKYPTGPITNLIRQMASLQQFRDEKKKLFESLTEREREVLMLIADGMKNPAIADELGITRVTVQNHRAAIRQKLNIDNKTDYIKYALAFDLIQF